MCLASFREMSTLTYPWDAEQLFLREIRQVLARPNVQATVGLLAIDECHLIIEWKDFLPEFQKLSMLRYLLRDSVCWFRCSATLSEDKRTPFC